MEGRPDRIRSTARAVVYEIRREDVTFMAASIAYHAFVSLLPILLLLVLFVTTVGSERLVTRVLDLTRSFLPEAGQQVVTSSLRGATGSVGASLVGVVVLLWGTIKIFRAMDAAFSELYDTERKDSLLDQFRDAFVVLGALVIAVFAAIVVGPVVRTPDGVPFAGVLDGIVAVAGFAVAFFPMYYVFPDMDLSLGEVVPGVLVAAVGWTLLEWLFQLYVSVSSKPDVYGLVGTLLLLVTWLYVGSLLLLVGAAVNSTLAGRAGDQSSKRRFGKRVTDADTLETRLDDLVERARDADVPDEDIRRLLRQRGEAVDAADRAAERRQQ